MRGGVRRSRDSVVVCERSRVVVARIVWIGFVGGVEEVGEDGCCGCEVVL